MEDESNIRLAYVTHEDIAACCPTETVLAVRVSLVSYLRCLCTTINCSNTTLVLTATIMSRKALFRLLLIKLSSTLFL